MGVNYITKQKYRAFKSENLFGSKYWAKTKNGQKFLACVFCGRDVSKQGESSGVMVGSGGSLIIHPEDYQEKAIDRGDMGWFPIGSECIKEVPIEFRLQNPYKNKKGIKWQTK